MGAFGNIIKYIMIVLVILFAIASLLALALYIFPGFYLFGYHVINSNGTKIQNEYIVDNSEFAEVDPTLWNEADAVRIETFGYDVVIRTAKNNESYGTTNVVAIMTSSYIGFMKGSVNDMTYDSTKKSQKYIEEDGKKIFYISIKEPENGFISRAATNLTLIVPQNGLKNKELQIVSNNGEVWLGGTKDIESKTITAKEINVTAINGKVNLNNINCTEKLSVSKEKGDIETVGDREFLCDMNLSISKFSGYINLPKFGNDSDHTKKLTINTYNAHTVLGDVYGPLKLVSNKGVFEATNLFEYVDLETGETKVKLGEVKSGLQLSGTSGSFDCENIEGNVIAQLTSGNCVFSKTFGTVDWESDNGAVTFSEPKNTLKLKTNNGNITINCVENVPIEITIKSNGGNINFSNAMGPVKINEDNTNLSSSCNIYGSFVSDMTQELSVFNTTSGRINLTIPQNGSLLLKWTTSGGNVNVDMTTWQSTSKTTNNQETGQEWVSALSGVSKDNDPNLSRINIDTTNGQITLNALEVA